jgi:dTDP-4-dehydrorhamnose 3,5-epimerase
MQITPTHIPDVFLIEPQVFGDERGFFMETFQVKKFADAGLPTIFVQDNHSRSRQGTLRGLHYQIKHAQGKLFRVIVGEVYDVAVDIRRSSNTFGQWVGMFLSAHNKYQLWVPPGFAHGFYVTSEWAEVLYKTTDFYAPEWERSIRWNDPGLGIAWPLIADTDHPEGQPPILSTKDALGQILQEAELFD